MDSVLKRNTGKYSVSLGICREQNIPTKGRRSRRISSSVNGGRFIIAKLEDVGPRNGSQK